ncbi:MAG TPA: hypothetical protein VFF27_00545 [Bacteroidia bacterium]|jgi:hypothetical protein|nr:hypothetical protein [Bacteroidia bacterium]
MVDSNAPRLSGFNIELPESNFFINVQDTNGNLLDDADIRIDFDGNFIEGKTDPFGNFFATLPPGVVCTISVSRDCYVFLTQKIILVPIEQNKNLVFKVVDESDHPIEGAHVQVNSSEPLQVAGDTDSNGVFGSNVNTDYTNILKIEKQDFDTLTHMYNPVTEIDWIASNFRIVPVITMKSNLQA